ncbi:MAG: protein-L-isoaspartate(D-aspartate) O-methyltransferase [Bacteroidetes bacterium]|nr:protein-L-isoaspartate(D-aspartate) O-methyltransferase [Bacteroidota bacterium]
MNVRQPVPIGVLFCLAFAGLWQCNDPRVSDSPDVFRQKRLEMVETQIAERGILDTAVLRAMRTVPRHRFVGDADADAAYGDHPLHIGYGQTISQPYIVALMTELVRPSGLKRVLEIGTGSGYQAAVLAELVDSVFSIEIVQPLATEATERLQRLGYHSVVVRWGDGYAGWAEKAPFDAIVVTAAAPEIPAPLVEQLKEGGRMVIPYGEAGGIQQLLLLEKKDGRLNERVVLPVRFVPLVH